MPSLQNEIPRESALGLRSVPWPARSDLRLRGRLSAGTSARKKSKQGKSLWRYRELLPIEGNPRTGLYSGFALVKANRLAKKIGVRELYLKDDSVNHSTFWSKDRVVSVAATRAVELGFDVFGCASTGNLANSVSAHAAQRHVYVC